MKKYITLIGLTIYLMLAAFTVTHAQENNYLKVVYNGKTNNVYTVTITNKQSCNIDIQFDFAGTVTSVLPAGSSNNLAFNKLEASQTKSFLITGSLTELKVRSINTCSSNTNSPWITVNMTVFNTLPLLFGEVTVKPYHSS